MSPRLRLLVLTTLILALALAAEALYLAGRALELNGPSAARGFWAGSLWSGRSLLRGGLRFLRWQFRFSRLRLSLDVIAIAAAIEGALLYRFWLQLNNISPGGGLKGLVYDFSTLLVDPFRGFEPEKPIKTSGIIEIANLAAINAYLAIALVLLAVIYAVSFVWRRTPAGRPRRMILMPGPLREEMPSLVTARVRRTG